MKVNELVKKAEAYIEMPRFQTYTNVVSVEKALSTISDAKSKLNFIKNSFQVLKEFSLEVGYHSRAFVVNVYQTYIIFSFDRDLVIENIPVTVTSNDVDVAVLQREKWNSMSNQECVCFAIDCHISHLEKLQTKYEEWFNFLESEVQNEVQDEVQDDE